MAIFDGQPLPVNHIIFFDDIERYLHVKYRSIFTEPCEHGASDDENQRSRMQASKGLETPPSQSSKRAAHRAMRRTRIRATFITAARRDGGTSRRPTTVRKAHGLSLR